MTKAPPIHLNDCPMCGAKVAVTHRNGDIVMTCSRNGCRAVSANKMADAISLWNEPKGLNQ